MKPFDKEATENQPFILQNGQKMSVPMMYQKEEFAYAEIHELDGAQLLQLPYENKAASLVVILPGKDSTLKKLEDKLTPDVLNKAMAKMRLQKLHVSLPKFKMEASYSLTEALKALGMKKAFTNQADFSRLHGSERGPLHISQIVQKVFIGELFSFFEWFSFKIS